MNMKTETLVEARPPCRYMVGLLNGTADGRISPWARWYALAHAARCPGCSHFLDQLQQMLSALKFESQVGVPKDVEERLLKGAWREEL